IRAEAMATGRSKERCKYWDKCYRTNPDHFDKWLHPGDSPSGQRRGGSSRHTGRSYDEDRHIDEVVKNVKDGLPLRLVLLGKTGNGKSSTANTILDCDEFKEGVGFKSETTTSSYGETSLAGRKVTVIDTPGICDTSKDDTAIYKQIARGMILASPGPHVFCILVKIDRFTEEDEEVIETVKRFFGDNMLKFAIVVFTRGDEIERSGEDFKALLEDAPPGVQSLVKNCGNRYFVINNRADNRKAEGERLVKYALRKGLGSDFCKDPHGLAKKLQTAVAKKQRKKGRVGTDEDLAKESAQESSGFDLPGTILTVMKTVLPPPVVAVAEGIVGAVKADKCWGDSPQTPCYKPVSE
ncbi:unnamed protein product, partial [Owenia fusiformis]